MRRKWRRAKPKEDKNKLRVNRQINSPEVFLINEDGEKIGKTPLAQALALAEDAGLDLVEVNPKADLPVAKILDYGQLKYEKEKNLHKQKAQQKKIDTKGIRLSVRISEHDFKFRVEQAIKFLERGHKLKIDLILKGREKQHPHKGKEIIMDFVKKLENNENLNVVREQDLTKQGGKFIIILMNQNK